MLLRRELRSEVVVDLIDPRLLETVGRGRGYVAGETGGQGAGIGEVQGEVVELKMLLTVGKT